MLTARNISVTLGHAQVLAHVDFTARAGQLTAIVGPNGSGKTTLLRALTGDVDYSGTVLLNGTDTQGQRPWQLAAQRAVLPQATTMAFPFTVIEVVRIGLTNGTAATHDSRAMQALRRVGLAHYANRFYQELSGGEQQRVQLARVLCQVWAPVEDGAPRWLLLDEPVASLDIGHQLEVMEIARGFARSGGGVVAVMHDLNLTALYADEVAMLAGGRLLAHGTPADVLTDATLSDAYGCALRVNTAPQAGHTFILPHAANLMTENWSAS
ncbi:heme ABC transporter ATP-binding protein [Litoreibacter albidus]|uniref:Iron complex transport system ATP-binding protein n=1 Tax=Litoreibacter albidus TaxID=670155 RepID=A0A1H3DHK3_9RHOB|nr:heme ABC transporter ATP-binding protein [Litoreibacter albidus]SDX65896.1 iron complex transport system ATP-binding protein [Litoreibacter albidus]